MALHKIKGVKHYMADDAGLKDFASSADMGAASLAVAQRLAGNANAVGDSTYEAASATVTAGWANERRAGAVVREVTPHWRDSRDAVLLRVAESMAIRTGAVDERVVYTRRDGSTRLASQAQADNWSRGSR